LPAKDILLMPAMPNEDFMREAIALARANVRGGGRPFGAVVVQGGEVIARAANDIHRTQDPTAHAEMQAIRQASHRLGSARLDGCVIYASGHPCPMCLAAMHLCGIEAAYFAYSNEEGEPHGLSTAAVYAEMARPAAAQSLALRQLRPANEAGLYNEWVNAGALSGQ
jgi:tRNA(Arg) A34 adenosine deaminase TadA